MKRAVFPGSFDPFTIGHYDIVCRGLKLFDEIIIGVGCNIKKNSLYTVNQRVEQIQRVFSHEPRVKVATYDNLTIDFASEQKAGFILRGARSSTDFEYERNLADINRCLSGIETVIICSTPQYSMVSSSMVRELLHYGKDISEFLPK